MDAVKAVARGERIDRVFRKLGQAGIADVRERLKIAEMVAPFIPGVGTGVAAALGAANALASVTPITEAVLFQLGAPSPAERSYKRVSMSR